MGRLIDADALEEMFKTQYGCETCDNYDGVRCRACHCDYALGIIDMAPTIDAAPVRRGEWEDYWVLEAGIEAVYLKCSACGYWGSFEYNFCPDCGADMRGETNDTRQSL